MLAGERWSDHPRCTHPLLAGVARQINDHTSDAARSRLAVMVPAVIGLTGDDPRVDVGIVARCAAAALPVVAEHRQRTLAVGLLAAQRMRGEIEREMVGPSGLADPFDDAQNALASVPHAARWAESFAKGNDLTMRSFQRISAPATTRVAIVGIAEACIPDPDEVLYGLLRSVISDCTGWIGATPTPAHLADDTPGVPLR